MSTQFRTRTSVRRTPDGEITGNAHYVTVIEPGAEELVIGRVLESMGGTFEVEYFVDHDPANIVRLNPEPGVRNGQMALVERYHVEMSREEMDQ